MKKTVRVILSSEAEEVYIYLNKEVADAIKRTPEVQILEMFLKKKEIIKQNIHYGLPIAKNLIPKEYKEKYGVTNLFWVELPYFWRFLYTLTNDESEIEIIAFVLDIMDHKKYNKKMGYKNK